MHKENEVVGLIMKEKTEVYFINYKFGLPTLRWLYRKAEIYYCN